MNKTLALLSLLLAGCASSSPGTYMEEIARRANTTVLADGIYPGPENAVELARAEKIDRLFSGTLGYHSYKEKIGKYLTRPKVLHAESPVYPLWARQAELSAKVDSAVLIDKNGSVKTAKILFSSDERFNDAAIDSAKKWKFTGGLTDGVPDTFIVVVPVKFLFMPALINLY